MEKIEDIVDNYYVQKFIRFMNIAFCVNVPSILDFDIDTIDANVSSSIQLLSTPLDNKTSSKYIQPPTPINNVTLSKYIKPNIYIIDDYI